MEAPAAEGNVADRYPIAKRINNENLIPSNGRDWLPEHQVLSTAEFTGDDKVTVHNVRNAQWLTAVDCIVQRDDRSYEPQRAVPVGGLRARRSTSFCNQRNRPCRPAAPLVPRMR